MVHTAKTCSKPRLLTVLLCLLLTGTAFSQTPEQLENFIGNVDKWAEAKDYSKVAQVVRYYADAGLKAFDLVLKRHQEKPDEKSERWLNWMARAYAMEGNPAPQATLKEVGILWADTRWEGTMFAADDDRTGHRGQVGQKLEAVAGPQDVFAEALAATQLALRVGNDKYVPNMLVALNRHLQKNPDHRDAPMVRAVEVIALEGMGLWDQALQQGDSYEAGLSGRPSLLLHLAQVAAARKSARPELIDKALAAASKDLEGQNEPLASFIVESFQFQRELQRDPEITFEQFTQRHAEIWSRLDSFDSLNLPSGLGRWTVEAAGFWVDEALARMEAETEPFPRYAQSYYVVWQGLRKLRTLAAETLNVDVDPSDAITFMKLWNPEFLLGVHALELKVVSFWRENGHEEEARRLLGELAYPVQRMYDRIFSMGRGYQLAHYGRPIKLEGLQFEFPWDQGEVARVMSLFKQEKSRLEDDQQALEEALHYQKSARSTRGYLGLDDARYLQLERLLDKKPPGWQAQAAQLAGALRQAAADNRYRPGQVVALVRSAELNQAQAKKQQALSDAEAAVKLVEEYLTEVGGRSAHLRKRFKRAYELLAELQLEAGQSEKAFATLARLGQAETMMNLDTEKLVAGRPELARAAAQLKASQQRTRALEQEHQSKKSAGQKTEQLEGLLASNNSEFYTALGEIRRKYPGYGQLLSIRPVNFARMQQFVPEDTAIVQVFPAEDALYLFVLSNEGLKIRKVAVARAELNKLSRLARRHLLRSRTRSLKARAGRPLAKAAPSKDNLDKMMDSMLALHEYLVKPVEEDIANKKTVAFIPSGELMMVPLQALARKQGDKVEFLIERKEVVTLMKSSDLERLARSVGKPSPGMLVVGNPDGSLPGAAEEAKSIGSLFTKSDLLIGSEATLERIKGLTSAGFIHLATHGILNRKDPNASYLVLTEGQQLGIPEIAGLDLHKTRLVTLSACETALGEDAGETSELTTLADAFGFAGCPTVIASLWKVSDESTKTLMERFYKELHQGKSPATAMRAAQLQVLATEETNHPYHWAAFTMMGDWR